MTDFDKVVIAEFEFVTIHEKTEHQDVRRCALDPREIKESPSQRSWGFLIGPNTNDLAIRRCSPIHSISEDREVSLEHLFKDRDQLRTSCYRSVCHGQGPLTLEGIVKLAEEALLVAVFTPKILEPLLPTVVGSVDSQSFSSICLLK